MSTLRYCIVILEHHVLTFKRVQGRTNIRFKNFVPVLLRIQSLVYYLQLQHVVIRKCTTYNYASVTVPCTQGSMYGDRSFFSMQVSLCVFFFSKAYLQQSETHLTQCQLAVLMPMICHFTHSVLFAVDILIKHTCLRLLNDSEATESHACISTHGQYCVISSPFVVNRA